MKKSQFDEIPFVDFHVVIRVIPETNAYSVAVGEIQDGQFVLTTRRPECCSFDWEMVKPNPLVPNQNYILTSDLHDFISELTIYSSDVMLYPNMLVFVIKDYVSQDESTEKENKE